MTQEQRLEAEAMLAEYDRLIQETEEAIEFTDGLLPEGKRDELKLRLRVATLQRESIALALEGKAMAGLKKHMEAAILQSEAKEVAE